MTPSVEITAAVEAVVPFESTAFEVSAGRSSREPVAAMPSGGMAGRCGGKNDRDPNESDR